MDARHVVVAVVLLATACGGGAEREATTPTPGVTSVAPETTTAAPETAEPTTPVTSETTAPGDVPRARAYSVMADAPGEGVLLFGGQYGTPPGTALRDLWSYSPGQGWDEIAAEDAPFSDAIVYKSKAGLVVVVADDFTPSGSDHATWTYDPAADEWRDLGTGGPLQGAGNRAAYDPGSDRVIVFGGLDTLGGTSETWALDVSGGTWEQMRPATSPGGRAFHVMAYDPGTDRVILFGGEADPAGNTHHGDTWAYDYDTDTWTELTPKRSPSARGYMVMVYDPVGERLILFGGASGQHAAEDVFGDTWAFDPRASTWTNLRPDIAPSPRAWYSMAFDAETETIVMFSGGETRDTDLDDVWLFDPRTDAWSQVA